MLLAALCKGEILFSWHQNCYTMPSQGFVLRKCFYKQCYSLWYSWNIICHRPLCNDYISLFMMLHIFTYSHLFSHSWQLFCLFVLRHFGTLCRLSFFPLMFGGIDSERCLHTPAQTSERESKMNMEASFVLAYRGLTSSLCGPVSLPPSWLAETLLWPLALPVLVCNLCWKYISPRHCHAALLFSRPLWQIPYLTAMVTLPGDASSWPA